MPFKHTRHQTSRRKFNANPNFETLEARQMFSVNQLLPGDVDCNGTVEFADFLSLSRNFGSVEAGWDNGDFDGDGSVGFPDFLILAENFGESVTDSVDSLADNETATVATLVANDGPDINPLKGFNSGWWRGDDHHSSVGFQYIEWGVLEPEDDQWDWAAVEEVLDRAGTDGRHLILQFVVDWDWRTPVDANYLGPDWLLDAVGERRGFDPHNPDREMRATNYDHPAFVAEATEAIEKLTEYFGDDERNFVLQTGVLGFWGEWHTFPREDWAPSEETQEAILDAYLTNIGEDGLTQVRYPKEAINVPQSRMGYTNGFATLTEHGIEPFGEYIEEHELWRNGPVGGEWPPNINEQQIYEDFFVGDEGLNFLNQGHYSTMLPPEAKDIAKFIPGYEFDEVFMNMHRQMGYSFQADTVRHLVTDTGQTQIEVDLSNTGIAPFYKDWDVQLAVLDGETDELVELVEVDTDLRTLQPGESTTLKASGNVALDDAREYKIGLRLLQPGADQSKDEVWDLSSRNTYIVLANEIEVVDGIWAAETHQLHGGWNILDVVER